MRIDTYLDQTSDYVVKMCGNKFDLCVQFITLLNAFACEHMLM